MNVYDLKDILHTIQPVEQQYIYNDIDIVQFMEDALYLIDTYYEDYHYNDIIDYDNLINNLKEIYFIPFEDECLFNEEINNDIEDLLAITIELYNIMFIHNNTSNDNMNNDINTNNNIDEFVNNSIYSNENNTANIDKVSIADKIEELRTIPQPIQRSQEWYEYRHNLITASNAYKAFESQSLKNQLIYEKCLPLKNIDNDNNKPININSPLHWGQKYEPLSILIYETVYNTKIEEFGCIPHKQYDFLGASPDGIVINADSEKYGRMIEIKNPVSRVITGIPKKEYWIQMQLQMEVCDLDICDFMETKFVEIDDEELYYSDTDYIIINDHHLKGILLYFSDTDNKPYYIYKPLTISNTTEINNKWVEEQIEYYENIKNMTWIKTIYWKLSNYSCITVKRDTSWFNSHIKQLEKLWNIILNERITGYQHRASKQKKQYAPPLPKKPPIQCLINISTEKFNN